jgi:Fe2+ transport system protein B
MDAERALTIFLVAFVAGSAALFVVLTVVGALTDGADLLRFGLAAVAGLVAAVGTGLAVRRNASQDQLTRR